MAIETIVRRETLASFYRQCFAETDLKTRASEKENKDKSWDFNVGWQGAVKLSRDGWAEGAAMVARMVETLSRYLPPVTDGPDTAALQDGGGAWVDIERYLQGDPVCYYGFNGQDGNRKPVEIVTNVAAHCGVDAKAMARRGAATLAVVKALELRGYSCGLTVGQGVQGNGDMRLISLVRIKEPNEALSVDSVAFTMAHPAFLRRMIFAYEEREPKDIREAIGIRPGGGYGRPDDIPDQVIPEGAIHLGKIREIDFGTEADAAQWALKLLRKAGVAVEGDGE